MSDDAQCSSEWERRKQFIRNGFPMPHCGGRRYTMPDDIAEELRVRAAIEQVPGTVFERAAEEIERLRKERDEARWEVCGFHHLTGFLAGDYAISRGWDYFNDERKWPKLPPSVTDFKEFLKGQDQLWLDRVDRLTRERDEARLQARRILNEIDCRIEHGAESNGHLEAIRKLFTEATDDR